MWSKSEPREVDVKKTCVFKSLPFALAVALCAVTGVRAASGTWNGAQNAFWTNSANWSASPYPSGGETATFSGASANTVLNTAGLSGILNIVFDTANPEEIRWLIPRHLHPLEVCFALTPPVVACQVRQLVRSPLSGLLIFIDIIF